MITDYEHMLISALRYALGRKSYIVDTTISYIGFQLPKLSDHCIDVMMEDIRKKRFRFAFEGCDWMCLLEQLEEEMGKRYG